MSDIPGKTRWAPGFRSFEFDLPAALLEQLVTILDAMDGGSLTPDGTRDVPDAQGVYQLFHEDRLVYIGKTDGQAGLRQRLSRHSWSIRSRLNLEVAQMKFRAVEVLVFSAMDLETALIGEHRRRGRNPAWNGSGFGSNDPGRRRDRTVLKSNGFDANYPIDIDQALVLREQEVSSSALLALSRLAAEVPYTVRHERGTKAETQLRAAMLVPLAGGTARELMVAIVGSLPSGWQATRLPGRFILYRERVDDYPGGEVIARS